MKKYITMAAYALLMVFTTLSLAACGSDDDDDNGGGKTAEQIKGKWMITHSRATKNADWTKWAQGATIQFNEKGEYIVDLFKAIGKGTYTVSGSKVNVVFSDGTKQTIEILGVDFRTAEVALYDDGAKTPSVYYKVSRVPTTADEAKKLIVGQWELADSEKTRKLKWMRSYDVLATEYTADGKVYQIVYVPTDTEDNEWYSDYKGQTIGWLWLSRYTLKPDEKDPYAYGDIILTASEYNAYYVNLTGTSMEYGMNNSPVKYRYLDKKIEFTEIPNPF